MHACRRKLFPMYLSLYHTHIQLMGEQTDKIVHKVMLFSHDVRSMQGYKNERAHAGSILSCCYLPFSSNSSATTSSSTRGDVKASWRARIEGES